MKIFYYRSVSSTMDVATEMARKGAAAWSVVVAYTQSTGRGRQSRLWMSPPGGMYLSIIFSPDMKAADVPRLGLFLSAAIAEFMRVEFGVNADTRWPNDVLVDGKKICGILTESGLTAACPSRVVSGIGLNLNVTPRLLKDNFYPLPGKYVKKINPQKAVSVSELTEKKYSVQKTIESMLRFIKRKYDKIFSSPEKTMDYWKKFSSTIGRRVVTYSGSEIYSGFACGIGKSGELIIKINKGTLKKIYSGGCFYLK